MKKRILSGLICCMLIFALVMPAQKVYAAGDLVISGVVTNPTTISPNSDFSITFRVTNVSDEDISDLYIQISESSFSNKSGGSLIKIGSIIHTEPNNFKDVTLNLTYRGSDSNQIPIKLTYIKGTPTPLVTTTQLDYITVNTAVTSTPGPTTTPVEAKPNFSLVSTTIPSVNMGKKNTIVFDLKNTSNYNAYHVKVTPDLTGLDTSKIRINTLQFTPTDTTVNTQTIQKSSIDMTVDDGVIPGTYPIKLLVECSNAYGDTYSQTIPAFIQVIGDANNASYVVVKSQTMNVAAPEAGDDLSLTFAILNDELRAVKNLEVWVEGLLSKDFSLKDTTTKKTLPQLESAAEGKFVFNYHINESVTSGSFPYKLVYKYTDSAGNSITRNMDYNLFVTSANEVGQTLQVENIDYPSMALLDQSFTVTFTIRNTSAKDMKNIQVLYKDNAVIFPKSSSVVTVSELKANTTKTVSFELVGTGDKLVSRNYPVTFEIAYNSDSNGQTTTQKFEQSIGVYIESQSSNVSVPKIIVEKYEANPLVINAGSEFDLNINFLNTHKNKTVSNIKIYLTSNEGTNESGSVFTPVNSSNTFFVDQIGPKSSVAKTMRFYTIPDAGAKTYTIKVNLEYEDDEGIPYTATELVGLHVVQPTKVDASDLTLPEQAMMGEMVPVYFDIFNTGKEKAFNVMVKAEGDFMADPMTKYIGNMESGAYDYFESSVIPMMAGDLSGKFIIAYDDISGEHYEVVKEFNMFISEMIIPEYPTEEFPDPGLEVDGNKKSPLFIGIIGGVILLVIIVTTIIILKKRKAKKEGLMFDED